MRCVVRHISGGRERLRAAMEEPMAESLENRRRRNGHDLRSQAGHVREDMDTLRKDMSQLQSDLGELVSLQWSEIGERVNGGARYVGEQVRTHPIASVGAAAGVGLLAGLALAGMANGRSHRADHRR
jgi:ElaB/YqjD/DUF883 family membrane-anchored ribosome-binding protein